MKRIEPVNGHIVLRQVEEEEQMAGAIYLPDLGKEKSLICEVIDVSPTFNFHRGESKKSELEQGNVVLVPRMGSQIISLDNEDYVICKETDIIGIVK
jgi:chaperonin GroES